MQIPNFGQPQNPDPYQIPQPGVPKRTIYLMFGGVVLLVAIIIWLFIGSQGKPGAADMRTAVKDTSESLGIIDEYEDKLQYTPAKNDIALVQILLRGNYQNLNALYNKTYKPKKKFSNNPKPDSASKVKLDAAQRNNVLDAEIFTVLQPKVAAARAALRRSQNSFSQAAAASQIKTAYTDYQAIEDILDRTR